MGQHILLYACNQYTTGQSGYLPHKMENKVSIQKAIKHYLIEVLLSSLSFITIKIQIHKSIPLNNIHRFKNTYKV